LGPIRAGRIDHADRGQPRVGTLREGQDDLGRRRPDGRAGSGRRALEQGMGARRAGHGQAGAEREEGHGDEGRDTPKTCGARGPLLPDVHAGARRLRRANAKAAIATSRPAAPTPPPISSARSAALRASAAACWAAWTSAPLEPAGIAAIRWSIRSRRVATSLSVGTLSGNSMSSLPTIGSNVSPEDETETSTLLPW